MNIGNQIRAARRAAGHSQEEVARRAGLSLKGMGDIERGDIEDPHFSSLVKIAHALDVPVESLIKEEEPALAGKAEASREAGLQEASRRNSARVVASLHDHAQIFRALADRLTSGLEQVRPEELPALVFESVWVANGASKMMAENVEPWLEGASPEELEAGQEAKRALEAIESVVYAISDEVERQNRAIAAGVADELAAWRRRRAAG